MVEDSGISWINRAIVIVVSCFEPERIPKDIQRIPIINKFWTYWSLLNLICSITHVGRGAACPRRRKHHPSLYGNLAHQIPMPRCHDFDRLGLWSLQRVLVHNGRRWRECAPVNTLVGPIELLSGFFGRNEDAKAVPVAGLEKCGRCPTGHPCKPGSHQFWPVWTAGSDRWSNVPKSQSLSLLCWGGSDMISMVQFQKSCLNMVIQIWIQIYLQLSKISVIEAAINNPENYGKLRAPNECGTWLGRSQSPATASPMEQSRPPLEGAGPTSP